MRTIPSQGAGDLAEARGDLVPEDDYYDVLIEKVTETQSGPKSKSPGSPMYSIRLKIQDAGPAQGRVMTTSACLWYEARFTIIQLNKSIGMEIDDGTDFVYGDPFEYEGQTTAIRVKHGEYDGRPTANVSRFLEQAGAAPVKASGVVSLPKPVSGKPAAPAKAGPKRPTRGAPASA